MTHQQEAPPPHVPSSSSPTTNSSSQHAPPPSRGRRPPLSADPPPTTTKMSHRVGFPPRRRPPQQQPQVTTTTSSKPPQQQQPHKGQDPDASPRQGHPPRPAGSRRRHSFNTGTTTTLSQQVDPPSAASFVWEDEDPQEDKHHPAATTTSGNTVPRRHYQQHQQHEQQQHHEEGPPPTLPEERSSVVPSTFFHRRPDAPSSDSSSSSVSASHRDTIASSSLSSHPYHPPPNRGGGGGRQTNNTTTTASPSLPTVDTLPSVDPQSGVVILQDFSNMPSSSTAHDDNNFEERQRVVPPPQPDPSTIVSASQSSSSSSSYEQQQPPPQQQDNNDQTGGAQGRQHDTSRPQAQGMEADDRECPGQLPPRQGSDLKGLEKTEEQPQPQPTPNTTKNSSYQQSSDTKPGQVPNGSKRTHKHHPGADEQVLPSSTTTTTKTKGPNVPRSTTTDGRQSLKKRFLSKLQSSNQARSQQQQQRGKERVVEERTSVSSSSTNTATSASHVAATSENAWLDSSSNLEGLTTDDDNSNNNNKAAPLSAADSDETGAFIEAKSTDTADLNAFVYPTNSLVEDCPVEEYLSGDPRAYGPLAASGGTVTAQDAMKGLVLCCTDTKKDKNKTSKTCSASSSSSSNDGYAHMPHPDGANVHVLETIKEVDSGHAGTLRFRITNSTFSVDSSTGEEEDFSEKSSREQDPYPLVFADDMSATDQQHKKEYGGTMGPGRTEVRSGSTGSFNARTQGMGMERSHMPSPVNEDHSNGIHHRREMEISSDVPSSKQKHNVSATESPSHRPLSAPPNLEDTKTNFSRAASGQKQAGNSSEWTSSDSVSVSSAPTGSAIKKISERLFRNSMSQGQQQFSKKDEQIDSSPSASSMPTANRMSAHDSSVNAKAQPRSTNFLSAEQQVHPRLTKSSSGVLHRQDRCSAPWDNSAADTVSVSSFHTDTTTPTRTTHRWNRQQQESNGGGGVPGFARTSPNFQNAPGTGNPMSSANFMSVEQQAHPRLTKSSSGVLHRQDRSSAQWDNSASDTVSVSSSQTDTTTPTGTTHRWSRQQQESNGSGGVPGFARTNYRSGPGTGNPMPSGSAFRMAGPSKWSQQKQQQQRHHQIQGNQSGLMSSNRTNDRLHSVVRRTNSSSAALAAVGGLDASVFSVASSWDDEDDMASNCIEAQDSTDDFLFHHVRGGKASSRRPPSPELEKTDSELLEEMIASTIRDVRNNLQSDLARSNRFHHNQFSRQTDRHLSSSHSVGLHPSPTVGPGMHQSSVPSDHSSMTSPYQNNNHHSTHDQPPQQQPYQTNHNNNNNNSNHGHRRPAIRAPSPNAVKKPSQTTRVHMRTPSPNAMQQPQQQPQPQQGQSVMSKVTGFFDQYQFPEVFSGSPFRTTAQSSQAAEPTHTDSKNRSSSGSNSGRGRHFSSEITEEVRLGLLGSEFDKIVDGDDDDDDDNHSCKTGGGSVGSSTAFFDADDEERSLMSYGTALTSAAAPRNLIQHFDPFLFTDQP